MGVSQRPFPIIKNVHSYGFDYFAVPTTTSSTPFTLTFLSVCAASVLVLRISFISTPVAAVIVSNTCCVTTGTFSDT